ncbi:MAG: HDOD domain-containing protein [Fimbriimonadales bacterium]|nr:HDOD domain-containing protein [Fimbriimonadales bacterium]
MGNLQNSAANSAVTDIVDRVGEIAAMPQVVYRVIQLTSSTTAPAQQIEDAISIDPGFSSKVLMLANSAYYALPRRVSSIREAATFMGYKTIRQLALTVGLFDMFVGKNDAGSLRRRTWWRHSVDTAVCARTLARFAPGVDPFDAYTGGLLHDIGKTILDRWGQGDYSEVEKLMEQGIDIREAERQVFGCDHTEVGAAAGTRWNFSDMLIQCIRDHHSEPSGDYKEHVSAISLANEMAYAVVAGRKSQMGTEEPGVPEFNALQCPWALTILGMGHEQVPKLYDLCAEAIANASKMGF